MAPLECGGPTPLSFSRDIVLRTGRWCDQRIQGNKAVPSHRTPREPQGLSAQSQTVRESDVKEEQNDPESYPGGSVTVRKVRLEPAIRGVRSQRRRATEGDEGARADQ